MEYNNEAKLKEQNSNRLTDSQEGTSGYQREGVGKSGWGGREKGIEGYYDWHTWCRGDHEEDS